MKTLRMSHSTETRNGHKIMVARGRASVARGALLDPDLILTGRRFRRANKLTHAGVVMLNALVRRPDGTTILPTTQPITQVDIDDRTRTITGMSVTTV